MNDSLVHRLGHASFEDVVNQICDVIQSGQQVDIERLANAHPEMANQLLSLYPTLLAITSLEPPDAFGLPTAETPQKDSNERLGDFQIVRQIGRGGMGVVYEAQQLSIKRTVALKVLPFAALVDPRALQRFKNEVTAIATLEHPNIVSIYCVGEDRGVHYFAMQLVRGQSLAAIICEMQSWTDGKGESVTGASINQIVLDMEHGENLRSGEEKFLGYIFPQRAKVDIDKKVAINSSQSSRRLSDSENSKPDIEIGADQLDKTAADTLAMGHSTTEPPKISDPTYFRNVVRLINQAAVALQHAHENGIVHRDVKPGNLLLDAHGCLFVSDFGLARIETAANMTMTGDVLGTLRYMSPEQVLGNRVVIDHRTDIYSLGVTMYEMLTLRPMWSGGNKAEVIRQISFDEPVGSQKLNPAISIDLDTIICKAICKDSGERYQTAQALADDLQRFLDNKPILATRTTWTQQVSKFFQRHPTAVGASSLIFLLLAVTFAASNFLVKDAYRNEIIARADEQVALAQAEAKSKLARQVVDDFYAIEATQWLDSEKLSDRQRVLLEKARKLYQVFAEEKSDAPEVQFGAAKANYNVAQIERRMGNYAESIESWRTAEETLVDLETLAPNFRGSTKLLFETQHNLAIVLKMMGRFTEANDSMQEAIKTNQRLVKQDVDNPKLKFQSALASYGKGDMLHENGELFDAEFELRTALEILEQLSKQLADRPEPKTPDSISQIPVKDLRVCCLNSLSAVLVDSGRMGQSAEIQLDALELQKKLLEARPDDVEMRYQLAVVRQNYAFSLENLGRYMEALELHRTSLKEMEQIVQDYPNNSDFAFWLVHSIYGLASSLNSVNQSDEAETYFLRLFSSQAVFAKEFPEIAAIETGYNSWPLFVAETHLEYGQLLQDASRHKEAATEFTIAIDLHPTAPDAYYYRGNIYRENEQEVKAVGDYRAAAKYARKELSEENENQHRNIELNFMLAASHAKLGQWQDANDCYDTAKELASEVSDESTPDLIIEQWQTDVASLFESIEN